MAEIDTKNKATTRSQALSNIAIQESPTPCDSRVVIISFILVIIVAEHSKPVKEHMSPPISTTRKSKISEGKNEIPHKFLGRKI